MDKEDKIEINVPETYENVFYETIEELEDIHVLINKSKKIYPSKEKIYYALECTPLDKIKVILIGLEPFSSTSPKTGKGIAQGLSYSVDKGENIPPATKNIYKELERDIDNFTIPNHGDLLNWTKEGVLLLNLSLTVLPNESNSHKGVWMPFVIELIKFIMNNQTNIVIMLWGKDIQNYKSYFGKKYISWGKDIQNNKGQLNNKNLILEAGHPNPFTVKTFVGCSHFSKCNTFLEKVGRTPVNWNSLNE